MDPNAPPFLEPQEINEVSGPQFLSGLLNSGLLGVLSVQVYLYYLAFGNDRASLKCLVYGIYILEIAQSVLVIESGFRTFVVGFGDVEGFNRVRTLWLSVPTMTAIGEFSRRANPDSNVHRGTFFVQGYYAHRISILGQSKKVAGTIIALSFIQLGGGIPVGVHSQQKKYLQTTDMLALQAVSLGVRTTPLQICSRISVNTTSQLWLIGSVLCDIIIAVCMIYYLSRCDTTVKQTKMVLKKVIRLTIETGSLTAVIGIMCFVLSSIPAIPYYYQFPMGIIGKVYANSMLVLINSRMVLDYEDTPSTVISGVRFGTAASDDEILDESFLESNGTSWASPSVELY
ncbi:hypothetical protein M413DRAFT_21947 [Hebeloma cylindrosporum]|uniref:DUF6534 domain-containing protein n=1 Tax=Hebeloma cylindrosporum TaxID=76867 RepID=A0A0C3CM93_HEBCY|nr:hypothetical protein M413DRAFT_21947 [Hebeloma cylindrosporum h7]